MDHETFLAHSAKHTLLAGTTPTWRTGRSMASALMSCVIAVAVLCAGLLLCSNVQAEPSAAEIAVARRLFSEATALRKQKKWAEAAEKLREALTIKDTPGLRFHLADVQAEQGLLVEALVDYDRADELIKQGIAAPDVKRLLGPARKTLQARVPSLVLAFEDDPSQLPELRVTLDGRDIPLAVARGAIPLNPGQHTLAVGAPGRQPFETDIELQEGEHRALEVRLPPTPENTPEEPKVAKETAPLVTTPDVEDRGTSSGSSVDSGGSGGSGLRTPVLIGAAAVSVVGLSVGIGYLIVANSASDRADTLRRHIDDEAGSTNTSACTNPMLTLLEPCEELKEQVDERRQATTLSTIGFVAGGIGAAAALTTLFLWPNESESVGVQPQVGLLGTDRLYVGLQGRF